jgi:DNA-binding response OmpR family regulator
MNRKTVIKLLVVDDDPVIRSIVAETLPAFNFSVLTAQAAEDALKLIDSQVVDFVVLDYQLPAASGLDVAARLRQSGVPFLFLSVSDDEAIVERAAELGALAYLVKPVSPEQLAIAIDTALHRVSDLENLGRAAEVQGIVGVATGLLMAAHGCSVNHALGILRNYCRPRNMKLLAVSELLVKDYEVSVSRKGAAYAIRNLREKYPALQ